MTGCDSEPQSEATGNDTGGRRAVFTVVKLPLIVVIYII